MAASFEFESIDKSNFECLSFEDSSVYFGETAWVDEKGVLCQKDKGKKKVRHGPGAQIFRASDGSVLCKYEGHWAMDTKDGEGMLSFPDGSIYAGTLKKDKKHGHGKFIWNNGDEYIGAWVEDRMEGFGTFKHHEVGVDLSGRSFRRRIQEQLLLPGRQHSVQSAATNIADHRLRQQLQEDPANQRVSETRREEGGRSGAQPRDHREQARAFKRGEDDSLRLEQHERIHELERPVLDH